MGFAKTANTAGAGLITSLMLLCIGIYARSHVVNKRVTWVFALFNEYGPELQLGAGGLSLVTISLIFSLLSALAFYKGDQAVSKEGSDINSSNDNENINTVMTNQQKPVPQQFQIPQSYLNPQSDTNNQPYSSTNYQPVV
nr:7227_t:CDS:2 [Entrophospora candida]